MILTGILGGAGAQLGLIQLGITNSQHATASVTSTSTVTDTVSFDVQQGPWKRLTDAITVTPAIVHNLGKSESVTDNITVTASIIDLATHARVTQYAIDVVYRKAPAVSLTHSITVTDAFHQYQRFVAITVSDSISVAQTEIPSGSSRHEVADSINVGQTCFGRNNVVRIGVTTSISCGTPSGERDSNNRQTIVSAATVTATAATLSNHIAELIGDRITVQDTIGYYTNPLRITVLHGITVTPTLGGGSGNRPALVIDLINVSDLANPKRPTESILDNISITHSTAGGSRNRNLSFSDTVTVTDSNTDRNGTPLESITHTINVLQTITFKTPRVEMTVADAIHVTPTILPTGPVFESVSDIIHLTDTITAPNVSTNRQSVTSTITVSQGIRQNLINIPVTDAVTVTPRLTDFDQFVASRIHVTTTLRRDWDENIVDTLPITEPVASPITRNVLIVDPVPIVDTVFRAQIWTRSVTDLIVIPDTLYQKRIDTGLINVPVAYGGLVTNYCTLQSKSGAVVLPKPQLGDGLNNVDSVVIQRSMNGGVLAMKTSSLRRTLRLTFRLDQAKAFELRLFLEANLSEMLTYTSADAEIWAVQIPQSPFELQNAGRSSQAKEFSTIELVLEGQKISG